MDTLLTISTSCDGIVVAIKLSWRVIMDNFDYKDFLGEYCVVEFDAGCNEPVAWGHYVVKHLGQKWDDFRSQYKIGRTNPGQLNGQYYVITKALNRNEAIAKYGPVTDELYGPLGGFKWVMLGDKQFYTKSLACPVASKHFVDELKRLKRLNKAKG